MAAWARVRVIEEQLPEKQGNANTRELETLAVEKALMAILKINIHQELLEPHLLNVIGPGVGLRVNCRSFVMAAGLRP